MSSLDAVRKLARARVRVVVSLPCYQANPELQQLLQVSIGRPLSLCESIQSTEALRNPVPLLEAGQVQTRVIEAFAPSADLRVLEARELIAADGQAAAWTKQGRRTVAVELEREGERYALVGYGIGAVAELRRHVASWGRPHPIYDRDTASGLERPDHARRSVNRRRPVARRLQTALRRHAGAFHTHPGLRSRHDPLGRRRVGLDHEMRRRSAKAPQYRFSSSL